MADPCVVLKTAKSIAVVGISDKPDRDSGRIALFLKDKGYTVYGVHPILKQVFGIPVYPSINDLPSRVDIIDVFLAADKIPAIIPDVLAHKPDVLWLQLGITNDHAVAPVSEAGISVIQDRCIAVEYRFCNSKK